MQFIMRLKKPITLKELKMVDKVVVLDKLSGDGFARTYFYDQRNDKFFVKRDFIRNRMGKASVANFSNEEISPQQIVESINWAISQGLQVDAYAI